jgi:hypothetical protein
MTVAYLTSPTVIWIPSFRHWLYGWRGNLDAERRRFHLHRIHEQRQVMVVVVMVACGVLERTSHHERSLYDRHIL